MEKQMADRIERLEYHQQLLLNMINKKGHAFDWLIITRQLSKDETEQFYQLCEDLNIQYQEQKEDEFVFHAPLLQEFTHRLHRKLDVRETIEACLDQGLFQPLMLLLKGLLD